MAERRIINGVLYEKGDDGIIRRVSLPTAPTTIPLPPSAKELAAERRAEEANQRAAAAEQRAQMKFEREDTIAPTPGDSRLTGEDYLKTISPGLAAQVRALSEGRRAFPTGTALKDPAIRELIAAATQYDPTLDAANAATRVNTRKDFTSGVTARNITALNTALGHLGALSKAADELNNRDFRTWNTIGNAVLTEFGDKRVKNFAIARDAVANELMRVFRGAGSGSMQEIEEWKRTIDSSDSPDQLHAAITQAVDLLDSRLQSLGDQYQRGMGQTKDPVTLLSPHAQEVYSALGPGGTGVVPDDKKTPPAIGGLIGGGTGGGGTPPGLMPGGGGEKSLPIPPEMQAAHAQYLAQHWGHIDPNDYASFRAQLDKQFGFAPRMDAYRAIVPDLNKRAANGGSPSGLNIPPVDAKANGLDKFNATVFNNPFGAALLGAGSLGGGMDELVGAIKAPFTGRSIDEEIARANAIRQAASSEYPKASFAGNVGGTLALAGLTGGGSLATAAGEAPILTGIGFGAANGFLESNDNRIGGAVGGAALGGAGGAAGKYALAPVAKVIMDTKAGQAASKTARYGYNRMFGNRLLPAIDAAPVVPDFQMGEKALPGSETLANARTNLTEASNLGLPYALADADPKLRMLAGSVSRKSPNARDLAEKTFDPRALGQADRAVQAIDTHLAPITNIEQRGADLLAAGDQAAGPSYNLAFDRAGPVDPQINAMLDTPAGRASLAHARTIAANKGLDPNKIGFDLNDQGEVVLKSVPSFETLQLVKRGMDAHLNSFADQFGNLNLRGNPLAQSVLDLKSRFNTKLGELNPNYAEGNRIWSGFAQRKDALDQGYKVLPNNAVPQRQFDTAIAGMTPETLPEAQMGYATSMADTANKARLSADPYNSIYGSPLQQRKVAALFPEGAPTFGKIYDFERDMAKTRGETLGGSPTASRLAADQIFESPGGQALDAAIQLKTGGGVSLAQAAKIGSKVAQNYKLGLGVKKADALAPILFNTDTQSALNYLDDLALRKIQDEVRSRAFQRRYGMFGALGAPSIQQP